MITTFVVCPCLTRLGVVDVAVGSAFTVKAALFVTFRRRDW
jgi:hypothetical protein